MVEDHIIQMDKCSKQSNERGGRFHMSPHDIIIEIKGSLMLKRARPIRTPANLQNKSKYYEYHEDYDHTTLECRELKKAPTK